MALLEDMVIVETDIKNACSTALTRGVGVVFQTTGSGNVLGDAAGVVKVIADPSGLKFAGIALNDVVDIDETVYHRNYHKDVMKLNERINLLKKGTVTTNAITGTPTQGDVAYLTSNGTFTPTNGGAAATPKAGQFEGGKDANGYATITINLPNL